MLAEIYKRGLISASVAPHFLDFNKSAKTLELLGVP